MQLKGAVRETWGELTNDDVDQIAGEREQLIGKLQERYGKALDIVDSILRSYFPGGILNAFAQTPTVYR